VVSFTGLEGSDLSSIKAPRGCAVTGSIVTCSLGDIAPGRKKKTAISLIPGVPGALSATAVGSSVAPDPTPANATDDVATVVVR